MIYLILDTNNWIYLASGLDPINNKHHDSLHFDLLQSLVDLTDNKKIKVLVNNIVLDEWSRNKVHCYAKIKSLENKLLNKDNAFKDIEKFAKSNVAQLKNEYSLGLENEISLNRKHIQDVENFLLNKCTKTEISEELKLLIFDLSIKNSPPFHNKKNNVGDAAILLSAIMYLKENDSFWGNSAIFISNNIEEYTDGKNLNEFHPLLKTLLTPVDIKFERVLPSALNISREIIDQMEHFFIKLPELAEEQFRWDIDRQENGTLMFLDVGYYNKQKEQLDFLTLCVAKDDGKKRPKGISFILPNYLDKTNGILLFFTNNLIDKGRQDFTIEREDKSAIRLHFEDIKEDTCIARVWDGYSIDEESGLRCDIFQKFLEFDSMFVIYFNEDVVHQSISIPLFSFRQHYSLIPE